MQLFSKHKTTMENSYWRSNEVQAERCFPKTASFSYRMKISSTMSVTARKKSLYEAYSAQVERQLSLLNGVSKLLVALLALDSTIIGEQPVSVISAVPTLTDESQSSK